VRQNKSDKKWAGLPLLKEKEAQMEDSNQNLRDGDFPDQEVPTKQKVPSHSEVQA